MCKVTVKLTNLLKYLYSKRKQNSYVDNHSILGVLKFKTLNKEYIISKLLAKTEDDIHLYTKTSKNLIKPPISTKKLQQVLVEALLELKLILEENNISYWLDSGTLLSCYRNKSFLPWDDDVDIGMLYTDFMKIKHLIAQSNKIFLRLHVGVRTNSGNITYKVGLYGYDDYPLIDIFLFDRFVNTQAALLNYYINGYIFSNSLQKLFKKYRLPSTGTYFVDDLTPQLSDEIESIVYDMHYKTTVEEGNSIIFGCYGPRGDINSQYISYSDVFPTKMLNTDYGKFSIPNNPEIYLTRQYGNYEMLPAHINPHKPLTPGLTLKLFSDKRL